MSFQQGSWSGGCALRVVPGAIAHTKGVTGLTGHNDVVGRWRGTPPARCLIGQGLRVAKRAWGQARIRGRQPAHWSKSHARMNEEDLRSRYCHRWATATWEYSAPPSWAIPVFYAKPVCQDRRTGGVGSTSRELQKGFGLSEELCRKTIPPPSPRRAGGRVPGHGAVPPWGRGTPKFVRGGSGPQPELKPASHFKSVKQNSLFAISRSQRLWGMDASRARRWAQERDTWREGRSAWASARQNRPGAWSIPHDGAVSWAGSQSRPRR